MALFRKKTAISNQGSETAISSKTERVLMFDVSSGWASFLFDVSNVILFIGAFAVAVGTWGTIKMGTIKEKFADERIAANESETARAKADGEQAKAVAAQANERAAEANKIAEGEKLARFKLEASLAPRRIVDQKTFIDTLRPYGGTSIQVWIFPAGGEDTPKFAQSIVGFLQIAGWKVSVSNSLSGLNVPTVFAAAKAGSGSEMAAQQLIQAIRILGGVEAFLGEPYTDEPNFGAAMLTNPISPNEITVIIKIGSK